MSIKINRRLGISLVEIEKISRGESVTMVLVSPINDYRIIAGPGDANSVNKITVQVKQIKGNKAIIALSVKN